MRTTDGGCITVSKIDDLNTETYLLRESSLNQTYPPELGNFFASEYIPSFNFWPENLGHYNKAVTNILYMKINS